MMNGSWVNISLGRAKQKRGAGSVIKLSVPNNILLTNKLVSRNLTRPIRIRVVINLLFQLPCSGRRPGKSRETRPASSRHAINSDKQRLINGFFPLPSLRLT